MKKFLKWFGLKFSVAVFWVIVSYGLTWAALKLDRAMRTTEYYYNDDKILIYQPNVFTSIVVPSDQINKVPSNKIGKEKK